MALPTNNNAPDGFKNHFSFAMATGFRNSKSKEPVVFPLNHFEKIGSRLRSPVGNVVDLTIKEMKNPVAIIGASLLVATGVTIAFYPEEFFAIVPLVGHIKPWMVKAATFVLTQATIAGVGMRAFGHFANKPLYEAWRKGEIEPIHVGDKSIKI